MPTIYDCDTCHQQRNDPEGWSTVSISLDATTIILHFDRLQCRETWCNKAGIKDPGKPEP